jgi:hypothetical protein
MAPVRRKPFGMEGYSNPTLYSEAQKNKTAHLRKE